MGVKKIRDPDRMHLNKESLQINWPKAIVLSVACTLFAGMILYLILNTSVLFEIGFWISVLAAPVISFISAKWEDRLTYLILNSFTFHIFIGIVLLSIAVVGALKKSDISILFSYLPMVFKIFTESWILMLPTHIALALIGILAKWGHGKYHQK